MVLHVALYPHDSGFCIVFFMFSDEYRAHSCVDTVANSKRDRNATRESCTRRGCHPTHSQTPLAFRLRISLENFPGENGNIMIQKIELLWTYYEKVEMLPI